MGLSVPLRRRCSGCSEPMLARMVASDPPSDDGERPTFTKSAPVLICPVCDTSPRGGRPKSLGGEDLYDFIK